MQEPKNRLIHILKRDYKWHVIYVKSKHEKKIHQFLEKNNIISFLPLEKQHKYWADRRKWIEVPLFPSYIFVKVSSKEYFKVFEHSSVKRYVCFEGKPVIIPEDQIISIRAIIHSRIDYSIYNCHFQTNERVIITSGLLKGCNGEVLRQAGKNKLLLRLDDIGYSLVVNISRELIESADKQHKYS